METLDGREGGPERGRGVESELAGGSEELALEDFEPDIAHGLGGGGHLPPHVVKRFDEHDTKALAVLRRHLLIEMSGKEGQE